MAATVMIYALCDPKTEAIRYIGKANNLQRRMACHKYEAMSTSNTTWKAKWLRSIGCKPLVKVLEEVPFERWEEVERRWIAEARRAGAELTNYADGGETSPVEGKGHTEEAKVKMRMAALKNGIRPPSRKGVLVSEETRMKCKAAHLRRGTVPPPMGGWNKGIRKQACKNGHDYTPENTTLYFRKDRGYTYQICKICQRSAGHRADMKRGY